MSRAADIAAFLRIAQGGLSMETLAKALRRRWPDADEAEVREAMIMASESAPRQVMAGDPRQD